VYPPMTKKRGIVHKTSTSETLSGSLHALYVRCGKGACKCASGEPHGPYWRHQWRAGGQTYRRYVRRADVPRMRAALAAWREAHPPVAALRDHLRLLRRVMRLLGV
jgi:hypothetical protein